MDEVITDLVNVFPAHGEEAALRALLEPYLSKQLRIACVKLKLNPQRRSSVVDNKAGYINLLCKYRSDKAAAGLEPTKERGVEELGGEPRTTQREPRAEPHDAFRLMNILFSPQFVDRMFEADRNQDRAKHSINENSQYWLGVARAYNEDRENYNALEQRDRPQYQDIQPLLADKHSSAELLDMWKELTARYTVVAPISFTSTIGFNCGRIHEKGRESGSQRELKCPHCRGLWRVMRTYRQAAQIPMERSVVALVQENLSPSSANSDGKKRRRLSPGERIANVLEVEHEEEVAERKSSYELIIRASTAVQSALTTLKMLEESHVRLAMIQAAEQKVNGLVQRWMAEMDSN